jgi:hypothetical protein
MGKSTINGHFQQLFVCLPEGINIHSLEHSQDWKFGWLNDWLSVSIPLINKKVSWDDNSQYMEKK